MDGPFRDEEERERVMKLLPRIAKGHPIKHSVSRYINEGNLSHDAINTILASLPELHKRNANEICLTCWLLGKLPLEVSLLPEVQQILAKVAFDQKVYPHRIFALFMAGTRQSTVIGTVLAIAVVIYQLALMALDGASWGELLIAAVPGFAVFLAVVWIAIALLNIVALPIYMLASACQSSLMSEWAILALSQVGTARHIDSLLRRSKAFPGRLTKGALVVLREIVMRSVTKGDPDFSASSALLITQSRSVCDILGDTLVARSCEQVGDQRVVSWLRNVADTSVDDDSKLAAQMAIKAIEARTHHLVLLRPANEHEQNLLLPSTATPEEQLLRPLEGEAQLTIETQA